MSWVLRDPTWKSEHARQIVYETHERALHALWILQTCGEADWSHAIVEERST